MTLSRQIAVGVAAGVGLGLLTGERTAPLQVAADAYVRLLQMTVLPYVVVSLIAGLGSLSAATARRILGRVGLILVALWGLAITLAFLLPLSFPRWETASFYSNVRPAAAEGFDFLGLYIPTNPFAALANNVVPAVVLFSVVIGLALIRVNGKESLLGPLHALARAIGEVNQFVMRLAPYGLFATAASLAGTMRRAELQRVEVYLAAYAAVALLLVLWVLPGLVGVLTPARYGEVVGPARDAVITAALTGSLFAVLPALGEVAREVLRRHAPDRPEVVDAPDIIVPASFNFPHSAKLLSLSFIPFAAWYSEAPLQGPADYLRLAGAGLLSFFGSLNAAVPFLLDLFHLPQDAFHLFQATSVINSRLGSAVAAMHTVVLAVLGGFAMSGLLRVNRARLLRYLAVTAGLTLAALGGLRLLFGAALAQDYSRDKVLASMERIRAGVPATVHHQPLPPFEEGAASALERIAARKLLRVGYRADNPPYTFFNAAGDLVGLDVEMAHQLARDLGVGLELAPLGDVRLAEDRLLESCCDVVMSGVLITGPRAARLAFTAPYFEEHLGFLVSDHQRARFATREALRAAGRVRVLALAEEPELNRLREYAPEADIRRVDSIEPYRSFFDGDRTQGDALLMPAERGATWSLRHPELTAVVPDPPLMTLPLGYVVGRGDERLRLFLNAWVDLKKRDGTIEALTDYWVYGRDAEPRRPRWNLLDDVLRR